MVLDGIARQPCCLRSSFDTTSGAQMEDKGEDVQPRLYLLVCRHALVVLFAGLWLLSDAQEAPCARNMSLTTFVLWEYDHKRREFPFLTLSREPCPYRHAAASRGLGCPIQHLPFTVHTIHVTFHPQWIRRCCLPPGRE